jgi:phenylacetate-coenzyme A ligase PaaK-like adenylate-forming protein
MTHIILSMARRRKGLRLAWNVWRTGRGKTSSVAALQQKRLADLIEFARDHSTLYRKLYQQLRIPIEDLRHLPPVTKQDLMANFDEWVTDPAVTRAGVEAFIADEKLVGDLYLDRYAVWTSSGVTGRHGIFLHDRNALRIYAALAMVRGMMVWMTPRNGLAFLLRGDPEASVIRTGGHYVGPAVKGLYRRHYPRLSRSSRTFSVITPSAQLVKGLNVFQPVILVSFPTVLTLLANEQRDGRLKIKPLFVATTAEWLADVAREQISAAFNCPVRNAYAASEFMGIAFDCKEGQLHVNSDWVILEPVDAHYEPLPPGEISRTALITNLANRVQPIIRYDLGDSITLSRDPCPCGSPLPVVRVEGRRDEILSFPAPGGQTVKLPPRALANVVDGTPGVRCFQVIQTAPEVLTVRLEAAPGSDGLGIWERVACRMRDYLSAQGLPSVKVERAQELPKRDPVSGKFRNVWADLKAGKV